MASLLPTEGEQELARLLAAGDETSLRQALELEPGNEDAIVALAELLVEDGRSDEALAVLAPGARDGARPAARGARPPGAGRRCPVAGTNGADPVADDYDEKLDALLAQVRDDEAARQEFVDILEVMGPDDPRTAHYRRQLTSRLF